ncbi:hypothetical protein LTS17_006071 [Exophiala oligosperma]
MAEFRLPHKPPLGENRALSPIRPTSQTTELPSQSQTIDNSEREQDEFNLSQSVEGNDTVAEMMTRTPGKFPQDPRGRHHPTEQSATPRDENEEEEGQNLRDDTILHIQTHPGDVRVLKEGFDLSFMLDWRVSDGQYYAADSDARNLDPHIDFRFKDLREFLTAMNSSKGPFLFSLVRRLVHRHSQQVAATQQSKDANKGLKKEMRKLTRENHEYYQVAQEREQQESSIENLEVRMQQMTDEVAEKQNQINDLQKDHRALVSEKEELIDMTIQWNNKYSQKKKAFDDQTQIIRGLQNEITREKQASANLRKLNAQFRARQAEGQSSYVEQSSRTTPRRSLPVGAVPPDDSDPSSDSDVGDGPRRREPSGPPFRQERGHSHVSQNTSSTQTASKYRIKIPDPAEYDGDRKTYGFWKSKMVHKIGSEKDYFDQLEQPEKARIEYIASRLGINAHATVKYRLPSHAAAHKCFATAAELWDFLDQLCEDPDEKETATVEFDDLRQRKDQSFDEFYAEFCRLVNHLDMTQETKMSYLEKKVSRRMRDRLNNGIKVHDLRQLVDKCRAMERALQIQDRNELRNTRKTVSFRPPKVTRVQESTTVTTSPTTRVDKETRQRYRNENRCFGCGKIGCRPSNPDCSAYKSRISQDRGNQKTSSKTALNALTMDSSDDSPDEDNAENDAIPETSPAAESGDSSDSEN